MPVRYSIAAMLLLGTAVNYLDRVNISVAAPSMMAATGLNKSQFGLVFSSFLLGYAIMQIPAGLMSDKKNTARLLLFAFILLSLFTALTPLASQILIALVGVRFLLGLAESMIFPAITALNARWFPREEFARAQMCCAAGAPIGQMIAYPFTAWLVIKASWRVAFYASAALGLVWVLVWYVYARNDPREHPRMSVGELATIKGAASFEDTQAWSFGKLAAAAPVLILCASAFCFGFVLWTFLFWLPTYLVEARGLTLKDVGVYGVAIQLCGAVGLLSSGVLSDLVLSRSGRIRLARARLPGVCMGLALAMLISAVMTKSPPLCLTLLAAFYLFFMASPVAYHTTPAALLPRQAASIYGVVNCCASSGGVLGPVIVGFIAESADSWQQSFEIVATVGFVSATLLFLVPVRTLDGKLAA